MIRVDLKEDVMTGYFGEPQGQKNKQPDLREQHGQDELSQNGLDSLRQPADEQLVMPVRTDFGKRFVAGMIDLAAAYTVAYIVALIPFVQSVIQINLTVCALLLIRDWLYEGRGVGKNLMGLQVVDVRTGLPASLMQSLKRNIVVIGPLFVLYIAQSIINFIGLLQQGWIHPLAGLVDQGISTLGFLYLVVVVPSEAYRAYNRKDGRRFGDDFAGTAIVEAPMDFSRLLPSQNKRQITRR